MKLEYLSLLISLSVPLVLFLSKNYILNYIKRFFDKDIEKFKHDLELSKEIFRQELSKEALKATNLFNVRQSLYPEIFEKIKIAQGSTLGLMGLRYSLTFEDYSKEDFQQYFQKNDFLTYKKKSEFFKLFSIDQKDAIKKLQNWLREKEFNDCKIKQGELKNHLILKQLYISKEILELCFDIYKLLISYSIDVEYPDNISNRSEHFKTIESQIDYKENLLSIKMRDEIFGENK